MTIYTAQKWIGLYFLISTVIIGCYLLLSSPKMLPIESTDKSACFQIIIPVFLAQLTVIFQWIANSSKPEYKTMISPIPSWALILPPILALGIFVVAVLALRSANDPENSSQVSPDTFKNAVTFSVTLLNVTTVYLVARLFPSVSNEDAPNPNNN